MNVIVSLLLAIALAFGGAATVSAAQDDLPGQPLYGVKTLSEDVRLWLNTDPQGEVALLLSMIQTRVQEMNALQARGEAVPQKVQDRLQEHIRQALQVAAGLPDDQMRGVLSRIQESLQQQQQTMTQNQGNETMLQTRTMIENRLRLIESGLSDPDGFRNAVQNEAEQRGGPANGGNGPGGGPDSGNGTGPGAGGSGGPGRP